MMDYVHTMQDFTGLTSAIHNGLMSVFPEMATAIIEMVIVGLVFILFVAFLGLFLVYLERKVAAFFQQRLGPMRVGKWGTAQTAADIVKLVFKEPLRTGNADKFLFEIAPYFMMISALLALSVLPFAKGLHAFDIDIGVFFHNSRIFYRSYRNSACRMVEQQ